MAKDMFYYSGLVTGQEHTNGKCADCPYLRLKEGGGWECSQTEFDVTYYNIHGIRNKNCPYITKDI